jgi:hypothetical protein
LLRARALHDGAPASHAVGVGKPLRKSAPSSNQREIDMRSPTLVLDVGLGQAKLMSSKGARLQEGI